MEQDYEHLKITTTPEGVRTILLNRPDKLNAVNEKMSSELPRAIEEVAGDDAVRVVVITGAGRGFCAGLDLSQEGLKERTDRFTKSRAAKLDFRQWVGRMALGLVNCDKPVIAAINGAAAGAGFSLALGADIRIIKAGSVVTTGFLRRGLSPDSGTTFFLPRLVGAARATELIMTARDISAEEAERIGLAARIFPAEGFEEAVQNYAAELAAGAPIALTLTKRLLANSFSEGLERHLQDEYRSIRQCFETEDVAEAMRAFAEKRRPVFKGR